MTIMSVLSIEPPGPRITCSPSLDEAQHRIVNGDAPTKASFRRQHRKRFQSIAGAVFLARSSHTPQKKCPVFDSCVPSGSSASALGPERRRGSQRCVLRLSKDTHQTQSRSRVRARKGQDVGQTRVCLDRRTPQAKDVHDSHARDAQKTFIESATSMRSHCDTSAAYASSGEVRSVQAAVA